GSRRASGRARRPCTKALLRVKARGSHATGFTVGRPGDRRMSRFASFPGTRASTDESHTVISGPSGETFLKPSCGSFMTHADGRPDAGAPVTGAPDARATSRAGVSALLERYNRPATIIAACTILLFDRILPGYMFVGITYVIVVTLSLWAPRERD